MKQATNAALNVLLILACSGLLASLPFEQSSPGVAAKTPAEILKANESALALILSSESDSVSLGSGFFIEDGSAVITNFHVIAGAKKIVLKTGAGTVIEADSVYAFDEKKDLAILKVPLLPNAKVVKLGDSGKVTVGEPIVVIANPEGLEKSITDGLVSGVRTFEEQKLFQISAPVSHGSSGGPVFDEHGEVIGIVVAFLSEGQNLNFAIPINSVSELWEHRKETGLALLPQHTDSPAGASSDMEGNWAATYADSLSSGQLSFTLVQDGTSVRGTYTSSLGGGGTVAGQVRNSKFSFTLTQTVKDCPGTFIGNSELRSNAMIGTYAGTDCQGVHNNGTFSMTRGVAPIQVAPPAIATMNAATPQPIIEYGSASELKGVHKIFIYGAEPDVRNNMLKQFSKHPELQVVGEIAAADVTLVFGANTFSRGTYTHVWTDAYGHTYGNSIPLYGVTGEGSAVKFIPPNTLRVVWQFSATRTSAFQRRPSTNFVRDFVTTWEKANR